MNIKSGDTVIVISGRNNYRKTDEWVKHHKKITHKVLVADPKNNRLIVEGVNVATKHQKAQKQGQEGGIIKVETPIHANKVMLYCPTCDKGARVGHKFVDGKKVRFCTKCKNEI